jgi:sulfonate transport system substrate-binding protein
MLTRRHVVVGLGGFGILGPAKTAVAAESATLAFGGLEYTWSLLFVAEARKIWNKHGVDITAINFTAGRESMQAVLGGSAQFGNVTDTPVVFATTRGLEPLILASCSRYSRDMTIAMGPNSKADAKDPSSLKGKTIATRVGTSGHYYLSRYLRLGGLKDSDVKIVDLDSNNMIAAVMRGSVDGFSWSVGVADKAVAASNGAIFVMTEEGIERVFVSHQLLITNRQTLERRNLLDSAVRVLLDTESSMLKDRNWPNEIATRVRSDAETVAKNTAVFEFKIKLDKALLDDLVIQGEWAIDAGLAKDPGKDLRALFRGIMLPEPLRAAAPNRVDL